MEPTARIRSALPGAPQAADRSSTAAERPDRPAAPAQLPAIAMTPVEGCSRASSRPAATFLAHLIATKAQMPQTRARRRAEPDAAAAIYARASGASRGSIGAICTRDI